MLDDPCVVGGERLRELVLLAFLQEEEVQSLLHGLLTLDREELLRLVRIRGDARGVLAGGALEILVFRVEGKDLVVYGPGDRPPHRGQSLVEILHEHVLLAGVRHKVVPLQDLGVVLGDAALDRLAAQPHVGGKRLVAVVLLADVVLDVARHVELVAHVLELLAQHGALLHVHRGGGTHVRDHVLRLVGRDVGVHARELALDDAEPVVDEHRRGVGYLVLVPDPVLVVHGDEGAKDVPGALRGHVLDRQGDDVGVLVGEADLEPVEVGLGHPAHARLPDDDGPGRGLAASLLRPHDNDSADGSGERVRVVAADRPAVQPATLEHEVAQRYRLRPFADREAGGHVLLHVKELGGDRTVGAVEDGRVEQAVHAVVHVEFEPVHHLPHEVRRFEGPQLVVHVRLHGEEPHVAEPADVARHRRALRVRLDLDLGRRAVGRGGPEYVQNPERQADGKAGREPVPPGQAFADELADLDRAVLLGCDVGCCLCVLHDFLCFLVAGTRPGEEEHHRVGHRGREGRERDPERGRAHVVAVHRGLAGADVVGVHVDHVVLPDVVGRRRDEVGGRAEVDLVGPGLAVLVAQDADVLAPAIDRQVTRRPDGVQDRHGVLVDGVAARLGDLAEHLVVQVHEVDGHHRVRGLALLVQLTLDLGGDLVARHPRHADLAQHREVDAPAVVHRVAGDVALAVAGRDGAAAVLPEALGHVREVEQRGELRAFAVDDDRHLVLRTHGDLLGAGDPLAVH